jgi:uncharacterized membrane protein YkvA (DUF1232 family)
VDMNRFFTAALRKAASTGMKQTRLLLLFTRLMGKLKEVNWKNVTTTSIREKFYVFGRLIRAYALGYYRDIPGRTLVVILAAIIYFLNPIDLLPDLIPITGLTDDFGVLLWVYNTVGGEVDKFLTWEKSQVIS